MLSPSDFNNAVPQFTNGNYASNPINPQYIAEPDAVSYNRGTEPLQTLPAQWWNWFLNKFTGRFNKVNIYVKNIFNELAQVLSIFNITPDGTETTPTTSQLKTVFESCYPQYVKTTANLASASTTVNGHPLSSDVTVTKSDLGLGTSATLNTGTAVGCVPTVGTALGTTNNNILVTDSTGKLKPSGITVGTAASCDATAFRPSTWTPTVVCCAKCNGSGVAFGSAATCDATAFRASTWTPSLVNCSCYNYIDAYTASADRGVVLTCAVTAAGQYQTLGPSTCCKFTFNPATGEVKAKTFTGALAGCACCAGRDGSGCAFGTAARYACGCFRASTWTPSCVSCAGQSYCVMDYCANTTPLYLGYSGTGLTCAQVTHLAAFSTNYTTGKTVIKDVAKNTIQSWLGLGSAAYCAATAFRASSWTPSVVSCASNATCATTSCCAYCHAYGYSLCVFTNGSNNIGYGSIYLCNKNSSQVKLYIPSFLPTTGNCSYYNMAECWPLLIDCCMKACYFNFTGGAELYCLLKTGISIPGHACYCFYSGTLSKVFTIPTISYT